MYYLILFFEILVDEGEKVVGGAHAMSNFMPVTSANPTLSTAAAGSISASSGAFSQSSSPGSANSGFHNVSNGAASSDDNAL